MTLDSTKTNLSYKKCSHRENPTPCLPSWLRWKTVSNMIKPHQIFSFPKFLQCWKLEPCLWHENSDSNQILVTNSFMVFLLSYLFLLTNVSWTIMPSMFFAEKHRIWYGNRKFSFPNYFTLRFESFAIERHMLDVDRIVMRFYFWEIWILRMHRGNCESNWWNPPLSGPPRINVFISSVWRKISAISEQTVVEKISWEHLMKCT